MKQNKVFGIMIIALIYIVGLVASFFLFDPIMSLMSGENNDLVLLATLIIDGILTIYIFIWSIIFKNSSIYTPYWGIMPIVMSIMYAKKLGNLNNGFVLIIIVLIFIWGIRYLLNWGYNFKSLLTQDSLYDDIKQKRPKLWFVTNLFVIHLVPTIIAFIGMLPVFLYISKFSGEPMPTLSTWLGLVVCIIGIIIEGISDIQMNRFNKKVLNDEKFINTGLWKKSRHPNYFGQILFWLGLCVMGISFLGDDQYWILITSPILVLLLFVTIKIPIMEKFNMSKYPSYKEYKEKTNMILPFFTNKE